MTRTMVRPPRGPQTFSGTGLSEPAGSTLTFAEMGPDKKNEISMRRIALNKLAEHIASRREPSSESTHSSRQSESERPFFSLAPASPPALGYRHGPNLWPRWVHDLVSESVGLQVPRRTTGTCRSLIG